MKGQREVLALVRRWIEKAQEDLRSAEHLLKMKKDCPYSIISFHCQQCAEKYLKALLTSIGIAFPRSHDLPELLSFVPEEIALGLKISELSLLNRYAVESRYPGNWDPVKRTDAREALKIARKVRSAVKRNLSE